MKKNALHKHTGTDTLQWSEQAERESKIMANYPKRNAAQRKKQPSIQFTQPKKIESKKKTPEEKVCEEQLSWS